MSPSDAEIDALEQLQEAIESGDVSLLRKLLNQTGLTHYRFAGTEDRTLLHLAWIFGESTTPSRPACLLQWPHHTFDTQGPLQSQFTGFLCFRLVPEISGGL